MYGGHCSDKIIAEHCGFEIQDLLAPTREIASVGIHVERAIERVKNCNILKQILPNFMSEDVDKIWKVCCLLSNFKGQLVV